MTDVAPSSPSHPRRRFLPWALWRKRLEVSPKERSLRELLRGKRSAQEDSGPGQHRPLQETASPLPVRSHLSLPPAPRLPSPPPLQPSLSTSPGSCIITSCPWVGPLSQIFKYEPWQSRENNHEFPSTHRSDSTIGMIFPTFIPRSC